MGERILSHVLLVGFVLVMGVVGVVALTLGLLCYPFNRPHPSLLTY